MDGEIIRIAGDQLEGGGQILRISSALSCLLMKPIRVGNIRANRNNPGLRPQHLAGLQFLAGVTHADKHGLDVGSRTIELRPRKKAEGQSYELDTKTAGSVVLLLQAALPVLLFARGASRLTLRGGTNADFAPPIDYIQQVFQPIATRMGVDMTCSVTRRGFYPKGGGEVTVDIQPVQSLQPITLLDKGDLTEVSISAFTAGVLPIKVAKSLVSVCRSGLQTTVASSPHVKVQTGVSRDEQAVGTGCGVVVIARTSGGCIYGASGVGQKGRPVEEVGGGAAHQLEKDLREGGCVDEYLQDQLIILMALARGRSRVRCGEISLHTQTAISVIQQMCEAKFTVSRQDDGTNILECEGMGLVNKL